jgi:hypothetical protein
MKIGTMGTVGVVLVAIGGILVIVEASQHKQENSEPRESLILAPAGL